MSTNEYEYGATQRKDLADMRAEYDSLSKWAACLAYRGSIAHGMYVPAGEPDSTDDRDLMGVCIPPKTYYYGLRQFGSRGTQEYKRGCWDIVCYEFRKFVGLLAKGNPNVLSLLWLNKGDFLVRRAAFEQLVTWRGLFVGKHVFKSFVGYANGQLKRMDRLSDRGYRGAKRRELFERFGYDPKNASHLIRLLRSGIEFLQEGRLIVKRPDAAELLEIKRGEWSIERIRREADRLFVEAREAHEKSELPQEPDYGAINQLCVGCIETHFEELGE